MTTRSLLRNLSAHLGRALPGARLRRRVETHGHERDGEAGDTLVEVLIAIVVLGVAAVAMLVAFGTAFTATQEHRNLASIATAQKSVTQQIVAQLQNRGLYSSCAPVATYQTGANAVSFANLPKGYSAQVTGVSYWTAGFAFSPTQAQCVANSPQLISATVTYPTGSSSIVQTVVNNPTAPAPPAAGDASQLAFYTQPGGATGGQNLSPQPVVEVLDSAGNVVTTDLSQVVLTLNAVPPTLPGASLSTSCTGSENYGVVSFSGCNVQLKGTYSITATDGTLTPATSSNFTVSVGPPSQLSFTTQPSKATGGTAFGTQPQVTVEDAGGNVVTSDASTVNLAITSGTGTSGATLAGCSQSEAAGVITFTGCNVNKVGTNYTLTATDVETTGTLTATSAAFSVTIGQPAQLAFTQNPGASTGGTVFGTQPWVAVEDPGGNVITTGTGATDQVKLSIGTGSGTLGCTNTTVQATAGVAKFTNCKITLGTAGSFTLSATDSSRGTVTAGTSSSFTVAGGATKLAFSVQPANATGGTTFSTAPVVWVEDAAGDLVTTATNQVTLTIKTGSGTLSGCTGAVTASGGIATFNNCKITLGTQGAFTLQAAATGLTSVTSNSFTVAGTASKLVFTTQPTSSTGGVAFPTQPVVTIEDSSGNVVTNNTSTVTLSINSGTGTSGATLACSTQAASAGVATFSGCAINAVGTGYTLHAADGGLTVANSTAINITLGPASKLSFTSQPGGGANGATWANQPAVTVEDAGGNPVTTATNSVSLTIASQPGTGAALACTTNPVTATTGVATFSGCQVVGKIGSYTLTASASGLVNGTSAPFTLTVGTAAQLAFSTQPGGGANTATWATQPVVTVEDSGGNKVSTATTSVTLGLAQNAGGTLACTNLSVTANAGVATFAGCKITGTAGTYSLSATGTGLSSGTSNSFTITAGTATQLVFTTQPGGGPNGAAWSAQPSVSAEDVSGNVVTSFASNVTLSINSQPGSGATFSCGANPVTTGSGVATFTGCQISGAVGSYTLKATSTTPALIGTSATFTISIGAPAKLAFTAQPVGGTDGVAWTGQPAVSVEDAGGNLITSATDPITLAIGTNPGGTLACTTNPSNASGGVASFAGCQITGKTGTTYTLTASEPGLASATSNTFAITIGPATKLTFTGQPGGGANGATWTSQPQVAVQDVGGNTVNSTTSVTLALGTNPGGALACTTNPLAATGGTSSFAGCKITGKAGSYTLTAAATGLTGTTSSAFTITSGPATQLVFTTQPGGGADGANWTTQPAVSVEDQSGNVVTTATNSVTLALGTNPGGTLACTTNPLGATGGVASFGGCKITGKLGSYTLTASATGLTGVTSNAFSITIGAATQLAFTTQPGGGANAATWTTQPAVAIEDAGGNVVPTATNSVTLAVGTNPGGTLACTTNPLAATAGTSTFAGCKITGKTGSYTLNATATGLAGTTSNSFTITVGSATQLVFTTQPGGGANGATWTTQPAVSVEDQSGNVVTTATNSVTLALGTNPGGALACTTNPLAATGGTSSFAGCKITGKAGSYTLTAAATGLTGTTSSAFTITSGPATQLVFTTQPGGGADGANWTTQPAVSVEDQSGNVVTTATNSVTLALGTNPGGTLACTTNPLGATGGVASFGGCKITGKLGSYTLTASATGLTGVTSNAFSITIGAATQLAFTTQPGGGANAATWTTQPAVAIEDAGGNVVPTATNSVTLAVGTNPGGTLACTTNPLAATAGTSTFAGCKITGKTGSYTLNATATGLAGTTSNSFTITVGSATQLVFTTQPGGGANGATWTTQPAVSVEDQSGNVVTTATNSVTLALGTNPGGALACTTNPLAATGGTSSFAGCKITGKAGSYTLTAAATGLTGTTSSAFTITSGPATQLVFTTQPGGGADGANWTTQPAVSVEDQSGNVVTTATNSVTLALGTNPGGTLACTTNPLGATGGVASFGGCKITGKLGSYTLTASATGLTGVTSNAFSITIGAATQLAFTTQPGGGANAATWTTQPAVAIEDAGGNVVPTATNSVTLAVGTNPGGTLACTTNPLAATAGTSTFAGCKITGKTGSYTLNATATGLAGTTSNSFTITVGSATQLVFTTQPGGGANGATWTTQPAVSVEDQSGNVVTTATNSVTLALGTNPGGALACTTNPLAATGGTSSFAGCKITGKAGSYTLTAAATGLTGTTSSAFTITSGPATQLVFTTQPGGGADGANWTTQPAVSVEDQSGNVVTTATNSVTLALGTNPGGTLACTTNPLGATGGVASFGGCKITGKLGSYTLTASATGLTGVTSNAFSITIGAATQLAFTTQPGGGVDGTAWTTQPAVTVQDAGGNTVTASTASMSLAIITQPGSGATLACTTNPLGATGGVASFAGCKITGKSGSYTIAASSTGLTTATGTPFTITVGGANQLGFTTQPSGGANGSAWSTQPAVSVEDVGGNVVTGATNSVTLAIGTNPGGTLACTTNPLGATGGTSTFAGCKVTGKTGTTYTLTAAATGLTGATSSAFTITAGPATQLLFTTQPGGSVTEGTAFTQPVVTVEDANGNPVTSYSTGITLGVETYTPGNGGSTSGAVNGCTNPLTPSTGVATFSGCAITGTSGAGTYTLSATSGSFSATSSSITIVAGTASQLIFTTQPGGSVTEGAAFTQPSVTAEDASGNTVTTYGTGITLSINGYTANNGGSTQGAMGCNTNPATPATGVATFAGCAITGTAAAGTYTFHAAGGGLTSATSASVSVVAGAANKLAFTTQPGSGSGSGANLSPQPVVSIEDTNGNVVVTATNKVTLAIGSTPNGRTGTLGWNTNPVTAAAGVAAFAGINITHTRGAVNGWTLTASATGLTGATSTAFTT